MNTKLFALSLFALFLTACGGGSGDDGLPMVNQAAAPADSYQCTGQVNDLGMVNATCRPNGATNPSTPPPPTTTTSTPASAPSVPMPR